MRFWLIMISYYQNQSKQSYPASLCRSPKNDGTLFTEIGKCIYLCASVGPYIWNVLKRNSVSFWSQINFQIQVWRRKKRVLKITGGFCSSGRQQSICLLYYCIRQREIEEKSSLHKWKRWWLLAAACWLPVLTSPAAQLPIRRRLVLRHIGATSASNGICP